MCSDNRDSDTHGKTVRKNIFSFGKYSHLFILRFQSFVTFDILIRYLYKNQGKDLNQ